MAHANTRAANTFRTRALVIVLLFIALVSISDFELRENVEIAGTHKFPEDRS
jgi:hypothetical protein